MGKIIYAKETPKLTVKIIDGETNEVLFEIPNRNPLNVGELFSDVYVSEIIKKNNLNPNIIRVLVIGDFYKQKN